MMNSRGEALCVTQKCKEYESSVSVNDCLSGGRSAKNEAERTTAGKLLKKCTTQETSY